MTYCVALRLQQGMVFASDTRTNAGIDHISTFKKMYRFGTPGERVIVLLTAGNLATSQAVVNVLSRDIEMESKKNLLNIPTLFEAADLVGEQACHITQRSRELAQSQDNFSGTFLLGGQLKGRAPELYLIYKEGNSICATVDTPYFQIGESKYGKPILDRAVAYDSDLDDAIRAILVSFDSTIRSNLSVGFPVDLMIYKNDSFLLPEGKRVEKGEPYMHNVRTQWSSGLVQLLRQFSPPPEEYFR